MILIFSERFDMSTDEVCEWLHSFGADFVRINGNEFDSPATKFSYTLTLGNKGAVDFSFYARGQQIAAKDIQSIWFRRDEPIAAPDFFNSVTDIGLRRKLMDHAAKEKIRAKEFFYIALLEKPCIGNHLIKEANKFRALYYASLYGLDVPETLLSNSAPEQQSFVAQGKCITKAIRETEFFKSVKNESFISYTADVTKKDISDSGFPVLLQKKIEKAFELRVYYLKGKFYPMAIFSQSDTKTAVDYRRYNMQNPNRNVPYKLPDHVETALRKTMDALGMDNGSIDLIKSTNGRFVFLEVNPIGQFGMTSKPCNYYIERDIATWLVAQS